MRINFTCPETRRTVLSDAETRTIESSFFWTKQPNVTDAQTDGRTYTVSVGLMKQYLGEVDIFHTWAKKFLPLYNSAKIIKIDRDFPKLWSQLYCHLFYGSQCIYVTPVFFVNSSAEKLHFHHGLAPRWCHSGQSAHLVTPLVLVILLLL